MFSKLMKVAFFGCIVIAATVPAEAGLFDRILHRNGSRKAGCCQPQAVCTPAPCAPAPCGCAPATCVAARCASVPCAQTPCATAQCCPPAPAPSCLQTYERDLCTCDTVFANNPAALARCREIARQAYDECLNDATKAMRPSRSDEQPICLQPEEPNEENCLDIYNECMAAGASRSCARCYFKCLELMETSVPTPEKNSVPH